MTVAPENHLASTSEITQDLTCAHCSYNLRGLTEDKLCPECATPIAQSLQGNLLRFASPEWVGKLRLGTTLLLWAIVVSVLSALCYGIGHIMELPGSVLRCLGIFAITSLDPGSERPTPILTLRSLLRALAGISLFGELAWWAGLGLPVLRSQAIFGIGVTEVLLLGCLVHFGRISDRIPDATMVRRSYTTAWRLLASFVLIGVGSFMLHGASANPPSWTPTARIVLGKVVFVAGVFSYVIFAMLCLVILIRLHIELGRAADLAKKPLPYAVTNGGQPPSSPASETLETNAPN